MAETVEIPKREYDVLKSKADLFDHFIETEELSKEELSQVKKALRGPFLTKSSFLSKHKYLA